VVLRFIMKNEGICGEYEAMSTEMMARTPSVGRHYVCSSLLPCKYSNSIGVKVIVTSFPTSQAVGKRDVTNFQ
jgi:hypothetical protein